MTPLSARQGDLFGAAGGLSGVSGPAPLPPPLLRLLQPLCQLLRL